MAASSSTKPPRHRKPSLARVLKDAAAAGKSVKGAEVYADHVSLTFGNESEATAKPDPWQAEIEKLSKQ
jgi:hypothetical protein